MYGDWGYFKTSKPREVKGGIKLQAARGQAGSNWWAKRWLDVLNACGLEGRLTRGRSYARKGQVLSIDVRPGEVSAQVQGSQSKPYKVKITTKTYTAAEWDRVVEALSGEALFAAQLLAGEMPQEIETVFTRSGLSLLPARMDELETTCSCPDWSNPCKHTAAVYLLLGEEFDRDPFMVFRIRGMERENLLTRLAGVDTSTRDEAAPPPAPLADDAPTFWNGAAAGQEPLEAVRRPPVSAPLLRRLGAFPFWRGEAPLLESLDPLYGAASEAGMAVFVGEGRTGDLVDSRS